MKLRINSIFTLTILAVVLSTSSQVFAGWGAEGYSIFNTGETPITAPVGINIHYAQNNNGVKDTQTYYYDPDVPTLVSGQEKILMANHVAPIIINFSDTENTIPVGAATSEIKTLNLKIKNASGSTISYSFSNTATAIIPQHDFGKAGYYNLQWQAIDNATNDTGWETEVNFFHVVANVPEWTDTNCLANYQTSCPSTITPSSGTQISDGVSFHTVTAKLVDRYGNRVVSESGTKTVKVNFNFNNTTKLDQIAGTGDSARYESSEFSFNKNPGGNNTNWLTKAVGGDGEFELEIASYAPTSAGYTPISSDSFNLDFTSIDYSITYSNPPNLGNTAVNVPALTMFAFAPTLTALPEAMNYNGTNYIVPTDYSALQNITVNAPKRFRTRLNNASASANASALELGLLVEASETNVIWDTDTASIETPSVEDLTLDTAAPFNGIVANWNDVSSVVTNVTAGNSNDLRLKITPKLAAGTAVPEYFDTLLVNYVGYDVGTSGKHVRHKSETLDTSGVSSSLFNPGIEIIGSVKSDAGTSSKQTDAALNKSFGDIAQSEFKNAIGPNILTLTKNPASNVCDSDVTISTTIELTNLSCKNNEGSIFYFKNADVVLGDGVSPIALPSGAKTILIENGDLHIKSNLTYPVGNSNSFGVIILNGNIFIYPGVTNVVGAYYAEGSVISVNADGESGEDDSPDCSGVGFCDRSFELRNQLYWKGLIATQNTIGGSDKAAPKCPAALESACETACTGNLGHNCKRNLARPYDLAYLRTFHSASGGTQIYSNSEAALVVEYDSRIQSNPPPLFETSSGSGSNQLGGDLLGTKNINQVARRSWLDVVLEWFGW